MSKAKADKQAALLYFNAEVSKVQTLADGGLRFIFDVPETAIDAARWLMECKRDGVPLRVAVAKDE